MENSTSSRSPERDVLRADGSSDEGDSRPPIVPEGVIALRQEDGSFYVEVQQIIDNIPAEPGDYVQVMFDREGGSLMFGYLGELGPDDEQPSPGNKTRKIHSDSTSTRVNVPTSELGEYALGLNLEYYESDDPFLFAPEYDPNMETFALQPLGYRNDVFGWRPEAEHLSAELEIHDEQADHSPSALPTLSEIVADPFGGREQGAREQLRATAGLGPDDPVPSIDATQISRHLRTLAQTLSRNTLEATNVALPIDPVVVDWGGQRYVIHFLVAHGLERVAMELYGFTPIHAAAEARHHTETAQAVLTHLADGSLPEDHPLVAGLDYDNDGTPERVDAAVIPLGTSPIPAGVGGGTVRHPPVDPERIGRTSGIVGVEEADLRGALERFTSTVTSASFPDSAFADDEMFAPLRVPFTPATDHPVDYDEVVIAFVSAGTVAEVAEEEGIPAELGSVVADLFNAQAQVILTDSEATERASRPVPKQTARFRIRGLEAVIFPADAATDLVAY